MKLADIVWRTGSWDGIDKALVIYKEAFGPQYLDFISFEDWEEVLKMEQFKYDSYTRLKIARTHLVRLARTYRHWCVVKNEAYYITAADKVERENEIEPMRNVWRGMYNSLSSIEECQSFYNNINDHRETGVYIGLRSSLYDKAAQLASTFADWRWVLSITPSKNPVKDRCYERMEALATTAEDWIDLFHRTSQTYRPELHKLALQKAAELIREQQRSADAS